MIFSLIMIKCVHWKFSVHVSYCDMWNQINVIIVFVCFIIYIFPFHYHVMKWKHFPCYWPFVQGIHRSPVNSPHKGQWRGALMFSLICVWINSWVNNREAGDLRLHMAHYDVTVMSNNSCVCREWSGMFRRWMPSAFFRHDDVTGKYFLHFVTASVC